MDMTEHQEWHHYNCLEKYAKIQEQLSKEVNDLKEKLMKATKDRDMWKERAIMLDGKYQNWIE